MHDKLSKLKSLIKEVVGVEPNLPFTAKVKSVEGVFCSVQVSDSLIIPNVRLRATANNDEQQLLITPKQGSKVLLLSNTGEISDLTVIKIDQVDKIEWKQNGLELSISADDEKVLIKNSKTSLVDLFVDMANIIKQLKVATGTGPSGTPLPDNIVQIQKFEKKFKQLLK